MGAMGSPPDHYVVRPSVEVGLDGLWFDVVNEPTGAAVALVENRYMADRVAEGLNVLAEREWRS